MNGQPTLLPPIPGEAEAVAQLDQFFSKWPVNRFSLAEICPHVHIRPAVVMVALGRLVVAGRLAMTQTGSVTKFSKRTVE